MSIAFYDISDVVLDWRGRLVSAQADPAAAGLVEHLARGLGAGAR